MSMQQLASPADMSSLIKDIRQDAREIRQDAKAERDELESKLKAEYKVEMQQQKMEHKAELDKMRADMEARHTAELERLRAELTPAPTQELISSEQLTAIQSRLEQLHAAQLLSDEEFFALEDLCADHVQAQASTNAVLGRDLVCSSAAYGATAKLAQLVGLSGALASDAGFARQARRKFV